MNDALNAQSRQMGEEKRFRVLAERLEKKFSERIQRLEDRITALEGSKSNSKKGAA